MAALGLGRTRAKLRQWAGTWCFIKKVKQRFSEKVVRDKREKEAIRLQRPSRLQQKHLDV